MPIYTSVTPELGEGDKLREGDSLTDQSNQNSKLSSRFSERLDLKKKNKKQVGQR